MRPFNERSAVARFFFALSDFTEVNAQVNSDTEKLLVQSEVAVEIGDYQRAELLLGICMSILDRQYGIASPQSYAPMRKLISIYGLQGETLKAELMRERYKLATLTQVLNAF